MTVIDRFLKYVTFDTQSDENTGVTPSTEKQMVFAKYLKEELEKLGLEDISLDDNGYLFATLPANVDRPVPVIGFIAHMDTSPDMSGADKDNIVLSPAQFPELLDHKGEDLIVTDGHTLLGADDKAGIAEIVSAMAYLKEHPEIKHGKIRIGFNPDEEIGLGAHKFDVEKFGAKWAYTMDGGEVGELEFENFNAAAAAKIWVKGRNVRAIFEKRKAFVKKCADEINARYGNEIATVEIKDQYYNMRQEVEPLMHIIDIAFGAMKEAGVDPKVKAIRGGTDGAQLSFKGLPCPNIFAGGLNFHGRYEFVPVQSIEKAVKVIVKIAELTANRY